MGVLINPYRYAASGGPGGGYSFHRSITIDHTKVPNTDQTDFPVLFSGTYTWLKTVGNGGDVQNANGYDIVFTSDSAGSTVLDHEIETYNASTGEVNFWIKIPTLTTATDTVIYIWYGNSGISTSQENVTGVWSNNFGLVAHLGDGSSLDASDSTSNAVAAAINGPTAIAGQIDGGADFPTGAPSHIRYTHETSIDPTAAITVSLWFNRDTTGTNQVLLNRGDGSSNAGSAYEFVFNTSNQLRFEINDGTAWRTAQYSTAITDTAGWHLAHGTFDGSNVKIYTDGTLRTTTAFSGSINNPNRDLFLGELTTGLQDFNGALDEVRVATVARSADWISTEYNNQSSPASFYSVSSPL